MDFKSEQIPMEEAQEDRLMHQNTSNQGVENFSDGVPNNSIDSLEEQLFQQQEQQLEQLHQNKQQLEQLHHHKQQLEQLQQHEQHEEQLHKEQLQNELQAKQQHQEQLKVQEQFVSNDHIEHRQCNEELQDTNEIPDPSYPSQDPQPPSQVEPGHDREDERIGVRPEQVVQSELISDSINHGDLQQFSDAMGKSVGHHCTHTLDYLDSNDGPPYSTKEAPTKSIFSLALLHEILCNLKPSHELWDKIKYAAFLLSLSEKNVDFGILYRIYHQLEIEVDTRNLQWKDCEVKTWLEDEIVSKLIVKDDTSRFVENDDSKMDYDYGVNSFANSDMKPGSEEYYDNDDTLDNFDDDATCNAQDDSSHKKTVKRKIAKENRAKKEKTKKPRKSKIKIKKEEGQTDDIPDQVANVDAKVKKGVKLKRKIKKQKVDDNDDDFSDVPDSKEKRKEEKERKNPLKCNLCGFRAKYQTALDKHGFEKHKTTRLCTQCGHLSHTFQEYKDHDKTHFFMCEICNLKILGKRGYHIHMKKFHEKKETKKVPCDVCGVLLSEGALRVHLVRAHGHQSYSCDLCKFTTKSKYSLTVHKKRHFMKPSKCPECGKMVKFLTKHYIRKCSAKKKDRPSCELCGKTFALKQGLTRHMKNVHQGIAEFQCQLCPFQSKDSFGLRVHVTTKHDKESVFENCQYCNQKTGNLDYHMKTYHYEEYMKAVPGYRPPPNIQP